LVRDKKVCKIYPEVLYLLLIIKELIHRLYIMIYLTDNIYIKSDLFYYKNGDKEIKINDNNWHLYLSEYGWEKVHKRWIIKLNKLSDNKKKNSTFGCLDCGEGGNCLFNCISYALTPYSEYNNLEENIFILRSILSDNIDESLFSDIIEIYKISMANGEFEEDWDPFTITMSEFKEKIKQGGNEYWGDFLLLSILKKILKINIIILYSNTSKNEYYNYPLLHEYDKGLNTIILSYEDEIHFRLIGNYSEQQMIVLFNNNNIPNEVLRLINVLR
tara:strand:- start:3618 stop:4436 length:819 start_codon:yes stop_codon:yes gene_type:complete